MHSVYISEASCSACITLWALFDCSVQIRARTVELKLAIRERKLASRILTDIQDPGLVNGKLASRIFRIQDL